VRVVREVEGGVVRRVRVLDDSGAEVEPVVRFLSHLTDSGYSPNTVCAYAYDLRHLAEFLDDRSLGWNDFRPPTALEFLGYLGERGGSAGPAGRTRPSKSLRNAEAVAEPEPPSSPEPRPVPRIDTAGGAGRRVRWCTRSG
jgi:integrase/recombinase XerD